MKSKKNTIIFDVANNPNPILRVDREGYVVYHNPSADELMSAWQIHLFDRLPKAMLETVSESVMENQAVACECLVDDSAWHVDIVPLGKPNGFDLYAFPIKIKSRSDVANQHLKQSRITFTHQLQQLITQQATNNVSTVMVIQIVDYKTLQHMLDAEIVTALMEAISSRIEQCVPEQHYLSLLAEDEFGLILAGLEDENAMAALANSILDLLGQPFLIGGQDIVVGVRVGVYYTNDRTAKAKQCIRNANFALSQITQDQGNHWQFYHDYMYSAVKERHELLSDLRQVLIRNELQLHYQPQFDLHSNKIIGAEALLRWDHPRKGLIPAFKFAPLAEQNGLMRDMGRWVFANVCKQIQQWRLQGHDNFCVAVNMSALQFRRRELISWVDEILTAYAVPPEFLYIEITESSVIKNMQLATRLMQGIRELGVKIALDDFGVGYSSFQYLHELPIDIIKIDKSFLKFRREKNEDGLVHMLDDIVSIGKNQELTVVVEGVEQQDEVDYLKTIGCDIIQGYHVARPLPLTDFEKILRAM